MRQCLSQSLLLIISVPPRLCGERSSPRFVVRASRNPLHRPQRRRADVVLDSFGVDRGLGGGDADGAEEADDDVEALARSLGHSSAGRGEGVRAVAACLDESLGGLALCIFPYFVHSLALTWIATGACLAGTWALNKVT